VTASAIYEGVVYHQRLTPKPHEFQQRAHFFYLDLEELGGLLPGSRWFSSERAALARFRRSDYLGPAEVPLDEAVRDRVEAQLGRRPGGPIRLLTQVRELGYVFNPVSFYYCHGTDGELEAVLAEITNTPWGERFSYVLDAREGPQTRGVTARFDKAFHVSPFWGMEQSYEWRFTTPGPRLGVHMTNVEGDRPVFHAGMTCERTELTPRALRRVLLRQPVQPLRLHLGIYLHAALLWAKRTPFYTHPSKLAVAPGAARALPSDVHSS
jgi:DUF1365 family protein